MLGLSIFRLAVSKKKKKSNTGKDKHDMLRNNF